MFKESYHPFLSLSPEITILGGILSLLLIISFKKNVRLSVLFEISLYIVSMALLFTIFNITKDSIPRIWNGYVFNNYYIGVAQAVILLLSFIVIYGSYKHLIRSQVSTMEYPVLCLLSILGMLFVLSSGNLIIFFIGLELQTLPIYALVALKRHKVKAGEAAIKYFTIGTVSTVFILYGISFIYGYTGTLDFSQLSNRLDNLDNLPLLFSLGLIFFFSGIGVKISAAPFHMWTPDVYEGASTPVTMFLATLPKMSILLFLVRFLTGPLQTFHHLWFYIVACLACASIFFGVFGALFQSNLKRLIGYSTVSHIGYMLMGMLSGTEVSFQGLFIYMILYFFMVVGFFTILLNLRHHDVMPQTLSDLKGLSQDNLPMAAGFSVILLSMAGIPPLSGFFGKLMIFVPLLKNGHNSLAIYMGVMSVIAAFYYLRVIKIMIFDPPYCETLKYDDPTHRQTTFVIVLTALMSLGFAIYPDPLVHKSSEIIKYLFKHM